MPSLGCFFSCIKFDTESINKKTDRMHQTRCTQLYDLGMVIDNIGYPRVPPVRSSDNIVAVAEISKVFNVNLPPVKVNRTN